MTEKICITLLIYLCVLTTGSAQATATYSIGASYLYGNNVNKSGDREFGSSQPLGIELYLHKHKTGKKYWEKLFNYPHTGWSISLIDHQNKPLGYSITINRYIEYILWRKTFIELYLKGGTGVMIATKIFSSNQTLPYNNAVSQLINFSEQAGIGVTLYPHPRMGISLSSMVHHFSNGAMSQPNDGLNLVTYQLGISYLTHSRKEINYSIPEKPEDNRGVHFVVHAGGGYKQLNPENETKYPLATLYLYADKKIARASVLNAGADFFFNGGVLHNIQNNPEYEGKSFARIGVSAGHELRIDRIGVLTQVGYHVYSPYPALSNFYQKAGVKYYFSEKLFTHFTLRAFRFGISDEISWGFGYRF